MLHMLLPERTAAAGALRKQYGTNVTMRPLTADSLHYVEDVVRAELRHTAPTQEFFTGLRREPVLPAAEHVMDSHHDRFGWVLWVLRGGGELVGMDYSRFDDDFPMVGARAYYQRSIHYIDIQWDRTMLYCRQNNQLPEPWAITFGVADGPITDLGGGMMRATKYRPLTICLPAGCPTGAVRARYPAWKSFPQTPRRLCAPSNDQPGPNCRASRSSSLLPDPIRSVLVGARLSGCAE
jgi:hypothetical protein